MSDVRPNQRNVRLVREAIERGEIAEVAKRTGLTPETLTAFALGRPARIGTLVVIADWVLETSPPWSEDEAPRDA